MAIQNDPNYFKSRFNLVLLNALQNRFDYNMWAGLTDLKNELLDNGNDEIGMDLINYLISYYSILNGDLNYAKNFLKKFLLLRNSFVSTLIKKTGYS